MWDLATFSKKRFISPSSKPLCSSPATASPSTTAKVNSSSELTRTDPTLATETNSFSWILTDAVSSLFVERYRIPSLSVPSASLRLSVKDS